MSLASLTWIAPDRWHRRGQKGRGPTLTVERAAGSVNPRGRVDAGDSIVRALRPAWATGARRVCAVSGAPRRLSFAWSAAVAPRAASSWMSAGVNPLTFSAFSSVRSSADLTAGSARFARAKELATLRSEMFREPRHAIPLGGCRWARSWGLDPQFPVRGTAPAIHAGLLFGHRLSIHWIAKVTHQEDTETAAKSLVRPKFLI